MAYKKRVYKRKAPKRKRVYKRKARKVVRKSRYYYKPGSLSKKKTKIYQRKLKFRSNRRTKIWDYHNKSDIRKPSLNSKDMHEQSEFRERTKELVDQIKTENSIQKMVDSHGGAIRTLLLHTLAPNSVVGTLYHTGNVAMNLRSFLRGESTSLQVMDSMRHLAEFGNQNMGGIGNAARTVSSMATAYETGKAALALLDKTIPSHPIETQIDNRLRFTQKPKDIINFIVVNDGDQYQYIPKGLLTEYQVYLSGSRFGFNKSILTEHGRGPTHEEIRKHEYIQAFQFLDAVFPYDQTNTDPTNPYTFKTRSNQNSNKY